MLVEAMFRAISDAQRHIPRSLGMALLLVGVLSSCVVGEDDDDPTTAPAATQESAAAGADDGITGCWTDDQRTEDLNGKPQWSAPPAMVIEPGRTYTAQFETSLGSFAAELFSQEAPATVNSFVCLANAGFFDGIIFHRVLTGFVIQAGDPTGTGRAGPGYEFADELPTTRTYERGTLAMANAGPNTNGSQFFVCLEEQPGMPALYSIFGQVTQGLETVDAIAAVEVGIGGDGQPSAPVEPVSITSVSIVVGS